MNLAVLASHNGSILDTIHKNILNKTINFNISVIITNNSNANVIQKAKNLNIPCIVINSKTYPNQNLDNTIKEILNQYKTDYILLAGYMKKIGIDIIKAYPNRIINSHPALLPKYGGEGMYGRFVHEAVISNKEKESGVTIHFVDDDYDSGDIILQKKLTIDKNWDVVTLEENIKQLEQIAIIETLKQIQ